MQQTCFPRHALELLWSRTRSLTTRFTHSFRLLASFPLSNHPIDMFHIDFGFIFGADPKPHPAPIRFTEDMVRAMGGQQSTEFQLFLAYCSQAYNVLRSHARFILNFL